MRSFFNVVRAIGFYRGPNRILGGIAGGIARQFGLPLAAVRIVMLILFLFPGIGVGTYLITWLITPNSMGGIPLERFLDGYHGRV
ncbi:MAG TPA: PspC domain-containing protein [Beutenbergiaceae bacterium]|nr:PspC domain-containing protein [Beutenbergiaceae bacterium]